MVLIIMLIDLSLEINIFILKYNIFYNFYYYLFKKKIVQTFSNLNIFVLHLSFRPLVINCLKNFKAWKVCLIFIYIIKGCGCFVYFFKNFGTIDNYWQIYKITCLLLVLNNVGDYYIYYRSDHSS